MDTTVHDPLVGRVLDQRYAVESRIARGGMATVYLAVDRRLDREVAVKVMHAHLGDDPSFTSRFIREARSAARLSHPNVVQVFDQGSEGELLYLAMEYLPGRTLRQVLAERGALTPREAISVLEAVLDALAAAHRAGLVHRDVKPENVILTDDGRIKVADFGLARVASATSATTGTLIGTVAYLSPELVARGIADVRSDVYSVGIMLFEMLTGRQPFTGDMPIQVAYRHVHEQVPAPSTLVPALPAELDALVLTATAQDPDGRPADAAALLALVRGVRAVLPEAVLDVRPAGIRPAAGRLGGGLAGPEAAGSAAPADDHSGPVDPNRTEVFGVGAGTQATRALPGVGPGQRTGWAIAEPKDPEHADLQEFGRRRRRRGRIALAGVLAAALLLGLGAWWFAAGPGAVQPTPALVDLTLPEAQHTLAAHGLKSAVVLQFSANRAAQVVLRTVPVAGASVHDHGTVTLYVSKGPQSVPVPANLVGLTRAAAEAALLSNYLKPGNEIFAYDDKAQRGTVLAATPAPGAMVPNGTAVDLTISNGPQPVQVPKVTGQPRQQAAVALQAAGFTVTVQQRNSMTVPAGAVISQNPAGGRIAGHGSAVTIVISQGPPLVTVPDVTGQQLAAATQTLQQAGFQVQVNRFLGGMFGTVRTESPAGGSRAPKGSTVVLLIV